MTKKTRHDRIMHQATKAFETHVLSHNDTPNGHWTIRRMDGRFNYFAEVVALRSGELYVGGDIDHCIFSRFGASFDPLDVLRWMAACDDFSWYVCQKARIGMRDAATTYDDEEAHLDLTGMLLQDFCVDIPTGVGMDTVLHVAAQLDMKVNAVAESVDESPERVAAILDEAFEGKSVERQIADALLGLGPYDSASDPIITACCERNLEQIIRCHPWFALTMEPPTDAPDMLTALGEQPAGLRNGPIWDLSPSGGVGWCTHPRVYFAYQALRRLWTLLPSIDPAAPAAGHSVVADNYGA